MLDRRLSRLKASRTASDNPLTALPSLPELLAFVSNHVSADVEVLEQWACSVCTLENSFTTLRCVACASGKKSHVTSPPALPPFDSQLRSWDSESTPRQWACPTCTLLNPNTSDRCAACDNIKDKLRQQSETAAATPDKRKRKAMSKKTVEYSVYSELDIAVEDNDLLASTHHSLLQVGNDLCASPDFTPPQVEVFGRRLGRGEGLAKGGKSRYVSASDKVISVEELAMEAIREGDVTSETGGAFSERLCSGGWAGWHCEGSILRSLFGLLLWDALFGPPGLSNLPVFVSAYQDAPLDLDCPGAFYLNRAEIIDERLSVIRAADEWTLASELGEKYRSCYRQRCRGVAWTVPLKVLAAAVVCLKGPALAHIFKALALDYRYFSGGLPDLFLIRVSDDADMCLEPEDWLGRECLGELDADIEDTIEPSSEENSAEEGEESLSVSGDDKTDVVDTFHCEAEDLVRPPGDGQWRYEACLVEVKGPSDSLSRRQWTWLKYLCEAEVPAGVCAVVERDMSTTLSVKRKKGTYVRLSGV